MSERIRAVWLVPNGIRGPLPRRSACCDLRKPSQSSPPFSRGRQFYEYSHNGQRSYLYVKRALCLFDGPGFDRVGIDHHCPHVAMTQKLLDGSDVIIGLQQVAGKTMTECVG